ncbi:MAG: hypothetical protein JWM89_880 [Acidimicrobiales bacterium]|nr:hypothetical protein [Acidimicrobiales bacterium]
MEPHLDPTSPAVREAFTDLSRRLPGLTVHEGARGHGHRPYASGSVSLGGDPPVHVEVLRSVRWHEQGVALWLAAGPFGPWAKPILPDVDHQEGGLTFLPDAREPRPDGLLVDAPQSQATLHDLWIGARWEDDHHRIHDGLAILVRPDAIVAHVHASALSADTLEEVLVCLPDVALAASARDAEWSKPVHPERDQIVWPAAWITIVATVVIVGYLIYLIAK